MNENVSRFSVMPFGPLRPMTRAEYHLLRDDERFEDSERYEFLDGLLVPKLRRTPPHEVSVSLLERRLRGLLPPRWLTRIKCGTEIAGCEPEPDIAVVQGPLRRYGHHHPRSADVGLLVEVADATLRMDRDWKSDIYARGGVVVYWIVNLQDSQIEVYTDPTPQGYATRTDYRAGDAVPLLLEGQACGSVPVADILP